VLLFFGLALVAMGLKEYLGKKFFKTCDSCDSCDRKLGKCTDMRFKLGEWFSYSGLGRGEQKLSAVFNAPLPDAFKDGFPRPNATSDLSTMCPKQKAKHFTAGDWLVATTFAGVYGEEMGVDFHQFYKNNIVDVAPSTESKPGRILKRIWNSINKAVRGTLASSVGGKNVDTKAVATLCSLVHGVFTKEEVEENSEVAISTQVWAAAGIRHAMYPATGGASPKAMTDEAISTRLRTKTPKLLAMAKFIMSKCQKLAHKPNVVHDGQGGVHYFGGVQRKQSPEALWDLYCQRFGEEYRCSKHSFHEVGTSPTNECNYI